MFGSREQPRGESTQRRSRRIVGTRFADSHCQTESRGNGLGKRSRRPRLRPALRPRPPAALEPSTEPPRHSPDAARQDVKGLPGADVSEPLGEAPAPVAIGPVPRSPEPSAHRSSTMSSPNAAADVPLSEKIRILVNKYSVGPCRCRCAISPSEGPLAAKVHAKMGTPCRCRCGISHPNGTLSPRVHAEVGTPRPSPSTSPKPLLSSPQTIVRSPSPCKVNITITSTPSPRHRVRSDSVDSSNAGVSQSGAKPTPRHSPDAARQDVKARPGAHVSEPPGEAPAASRPGTPVPGCKCTAGAATGRAMSCPPRAQHSRERARDQDRMLHTQNPAPLPSPFVSSPSDMTDFSDSGRSCCCASGLRERAYCFCPTPGLRLYLTRQHRDYEQKEQTKLGERLKPQSPKSSREDSRSPSGKHSPTRLPQRSPGRSRIPRRDGSREHQRMLESERTRNPCCCYCKTHRQASSASSHYSTSPERERRRDRLFTARSWYNGHGKPRRKRSRRRRFGFNRNGSHWPNGEGPYARGPTFLLKEDLPTKKVNWCSQLCHFPRSQCCVASIREVHPRVKSAPPPCAARSASPDPVRSHSPLCHCDGGGTRPCSSGYGARSCRTRAALVTSEALPSSVSSPPADAADGKRTPSPAPTQRSPRRSILEFYDTVIRPHCMDPADPAAIDRQTAVPVSRDEMPGQRGMHAVRRRRAGSVGGSPKTTVDRNPEESEGEIKATVLVRDPKRPAPSKAVASTTIADAAALAAGDSADSEARAQWGTVSQECTCFPARCHRECAWCEPRWRDPRWSDPSFPRPSELRLLPPHGRRDWAQVRVAADVMLRALRGRAPASASASASALASPVWARRPVAPRWRLRERPSASDPAIADAAFFGRGILSSCASIAA